MYLIYQWSIKGEKVHCNSFVFIKMRTIYFILHTYHKAYNSKYKSMVEIVNIYKENLNQKHWEFRC